MPSFGTCCCNCLIHLDNFDRADSSALGGSWCEKPGDWEIYSGTAKTTLANKYAILNVQHPVPDTTMVVNMDTVDESIGSGQKYRIMLNVVKTVTGGYCTTNSFYFADFIRNGTNDSIIKLGISSGGSEVILKQDTISGLTGTTRRFAATLGKTPNEFCASVTNAVQSFVGTNHAGAFVNGYYSGMAASHAGMRIDNFAFYQHYTTNPTCLYCLCACDGKPLPPELTCKIYPDPTGCTRLNLLSPCEFTLAWNRVTSRWEGEKMCCNSGQLWRMSIACPSTYSAESDWQKFILGIENGCFNSCGTCLTEPQRPYSGSCNPFKITFGPFLVSTFDFTCGACSNSTPPGWGSCSFYVEISA